MSVRLALAVLVLACLTWLRVSPATAETAVTAGVVVKRYALIVGNSAYDVKATGLPALTRSVDDSNEIDKSLRGENINFVTTVKLNIKDLAEFKAALYAFKANVRMNGGGDGRNRDAERLEILFYFSGHGFATTNGNFFLPLNAKEPEKWLKDLKADEKAKYKDQASKDAAYDDWNVNVAMAEKYLEDSLQELKPDVLVMISDACRNLLANAKGVSVSTNRGMDMPAYKSSGTFHFYAAGKGQAAFESLPDEKPVSPPKDAKDGKDAKDKKPQNSVFTASLLRHMGLPWQTIQTLAIAVKQDVVGLTGSAQQPFYDDEIIGTFVLTKIGDLSAICDNANSAFNTVMGDARTHRLTSEQLSEQAKRYAACPDIGERLRTMLSAFNQGIGVASTGNVDAPDTPQPGVEIDRCDLLASSRFDTSRPAGIPKYEPHSRVLRRDLQEIAVSSLSADLNFQPVERAIIQDAIDACRSARDRHPKVARYNFNLANALNAMAIASGDPRQRDQLQQEALVLYTTAVRLSYVAAFNSLAVYYENGYGLGALKETLSDVKRRDTALDYYTQGAQLHDTLAEYNLGMKYNTGELGLKIDKRQAYNWLAKSAEDGYVPAMVEAGRLLLTERGAFENADPKRALELFERAARSNYDEAMFWIGWSYEMGVEITQKDGKKEPLLAADYPKALQWYGRAADLGHQTAQVRMARMLTEGNGLPAAQPEAAGRYWRLAALSGSTFAQIELARLMMDRQIPPKPKDGPAEIRKLYEAAEAAGHPRAALELAKLYRTGAQLNNVDIVVKDTKAAVAHAKRAFELSKTAARNSEEAKPRYAFEAAFLLIEMHDKSEDKTPDGTRLISDQWLDELHAEYGDTSHHFTVLVPTVDLSDPPPRTSCSQASRFEVEVWDWDKSIPPTTLQFDWFDGYYGSGWSCGIEKQLRDEFETQWKQSQKSKTSFVDAMHKRLDELDQTATNKSAN